MITLWKDNLVTGEYQISEKELAQQFKNSVQNKFYVEDGWMFRDALAAFITEKPGLHSAFEDVDFAKVKEEYKKL